MMMEVVETLSKAKKSGIEKIIRTIGKMTTTRVIIQMGVSSQERNKSWSSLWPRSEIAPDRHLRYSQH
jgi:hypothetical protein